MKTIYYIKPLLLLSGTYCQNASFLQLNSNLFFWYFITFLNYSKCQISNLLPQTTLNDIWKLTKSITVNDYYMRYCIYIQSELTIGYDTS